MYSELWSLEDNVIRRLLNLPCNTHCFLLPIGLLTDSLPVFFMKYVSVQSVLCYHVFIHDITWFVVLRGIVLLMVAITHSFGEI